MTVQDDGVRLADAFETHRPRLRAIAYRMLGSLSEADDAVQESWMRLTRTGEDVRNVGGWLTTVVSHICLDMLRSRREEPLGLRLPDPVVSHPSGLDPEQETLLADSVGLALLVVLQRLDPAERLAFVLHDMFAVPFDEIAPVVERSAVAARKLASRARRRVQEAAPVPDADIGRQREAVEAFLRAAREGDFGALLAVLDPGVELRADVGPVPSGVPTRFSGARDVSERAAAFSSRAPFARPALVNGAAGLVAVADGRVLTVMAFTVRGGKIAGIDILADPERLSAVDPAVVGG
ncbi:sigma-70 family RNA polymerase sigma factor [Streptomyces winkii]|uniref:sigma-70 family RNA polymerase sigma factor n=1 Tax=Streptomyces winkii TaxID=3051178 RepID=UPI0028D26341|nr:sigma-70 family RNA polymerase sigma factor [Streptomyces sp. DSM 40971]